MPLLAIPPDLLRFTLARPDADGRAWLEALPGIVSELEARWGVVAGQPYLGGIVGYVCRAERADATPAVLKISIVDRENRYEGEALRHYGGHGAVLLLESEPDVGALLLERAEPGTQLWDIDDDREATAQAAALVRRLHRRPAPNHPFDLLADRAREYAEALPGHFEAVGRPFEPSLVERASTQFAELAASAADEVVLHQDLHGGNILAAQREPWLVIDPKPLVGDPAFDPGWLLRDRRAQVLSDADPVASVRRRLDQYVDELGYDRARIHGWAIAQATDAAVWSYRMGDPEGGERDAAIARVMAQA